MVQTLHEPLGSCSNRQASLLWYFNKDGSRLMCHMIKKNTPDLPLKMVHFEGVKLLVLNNFWHVICPWA